MTGLAAVAVIVAVVCGCIMLGWAAREIIGGFRDGWNKNGKPFWAEVAERVEKKRSP